MKNPIITRDSRAKTNAFWKLANSTVNVLFVLLMSLPFSFLMGFTTEYRIILVLLFLVYQLIVAISPKHISLGALATRTSWIKEYPLKNHIIFAFLYTLSLSTFVVWVRFPFDLLLVNLLLIQLPFIAKTGYTLHGYLSGKMVGTRT